MSQPSIRLESKRKEEKGKEEKKERKRERMEKERKDGKKKGKQSRLSGKAGSPGLRAHDRARRGKDLSVVEDMIFRACTRVRLGKKCAIGVLRCISLRMQNGRRHFLCPAQDTAKFGFSSSVDFTGFEVPL